MDIEQECFKLIINHYDVLHKLLLRPSYYMGSYSFKLGNSADALHNRVVAIKKENVKMLLSAIKCRTKIIEEFVSYYCLEDLCELFVDDAELCRFMRQLRQDAITIRGEAGANEEGVNRIVTSIRNKYAGNINTLNELLKENDIKNSSGKDKKKSVKNLKFLFKFLHLLSEDKPRKIIDKTHYFFDTLRDMKMLAIIVEGLQKHNFQMELLRGELAMGSAGTSCQEIGLLRFLDYFSDLADIVEIFRGKKQCCQFLERLGNDSEVSELLSLLTYFNTEEKVNQEIKINDALDTENAIKTINIRGEKDITKVFPIFKYYDSHFRSILHRELKPEDGVRFVFWGFQKQSELLPSIFSRALLNLVAPFLDRVECEEATTTLLSRFFPVLTMVEFINSKFHETAVLIEMLLTDLQYKNIHTLRDVLACVRRHPSVSCFDDLLNKTTDTANFRLVEAELFKSLLQLLLLCNDTSFHEAIAHLEHAYFKRILLYSKNFPGIFFLLIFNIFKVKFPMYDCLSQEKICLIFDIIYSNFPDIARCLAMSPHILGQTTHMGFALEYNRTSVVSLLFKMLKRYPKALGHLILFPKSSQQSCLHYAIVEGELKTLEYFLMELNRNLEVMKYVIERFVFNEEDKFRLFEAAEVRNPGALLIFLNNLKAEYDMFKQFLLPEDKRAKPAFLMAAERGCKEVMDTLLSALKSEPDALWELLIWAGPYSKKTVLHRACERGYAEIVEAVLDAASDHANKLRFLLKTDKSLQTALDSAILSKRQVIKMTSGNCVYNAQNELIESTEYLRLRESFGKENSTSEQIECLRKLSSALKYLPMVVNVLLIIAKSFNNVELMLAIFEEEDLRLVLESMFVTLENYSYRLFHCAIERDKLGLVRALIDKGIDVNCTDGYGFTPLMRAVQKNNVGIADLLLNRGADMYARDMNGVTALALATHDKNKDDSMIRIFHFLS